MIGYDELLAERVKQLKEIDERLERIEAECKCRPARHTFAAWELTRGLRADLAVMIARAEAEYEAF